MTGCDRKHPTILTLIPWQGSESVTWDIAVVSTLAHSYLHTSSNGAGSGVELRSQKHTKYSSLLYIYIFIIENRTLSTTNYRYNISTKRNKVHWASVRCTVSNVQ